MRLGLVILTAFLLTPHLAPEAQGPATSPLTLRAGDVIHVRIPREPGSSGDFLIDERGVVVLPMLGPRLATAAPWAELRDSIVAAYARELSDPSIEVFARHRVFVLGSVTTPGVFLADPTMSLAGVVAMAGGATEEGDLNRVRVVRDGTTIVERASVDSPLLQAGVRSGDQLFVERRRWFDRNSGVAVSALVGLLGVVATILIIR